MPRAPAHICLTALLFSPPLLVAQHSPQAIVARAIAAAGGPGPARNLPVLDWHGRAVVTVGSLVLRLVGHWQLNLPDTAIVTTELADSGPATPRRLILVGAKGWLEIGDSVRPLPGAVVAHERDQFYLYHLLRLVPLTGPGYQLKSRPPDADGRTGLRVSRLGRPDVDLYFERDGRLSRAVDQVTDPRTGASVRQEVELSGAIESSGVRWPTRMTITWNGRPYFDITVLTFQALAQLSDSALATLDRFR